MALKARLQAFQGMILSKCNYSFLIQVPRFPTDIQDPCYFIYNFAAFIFLHTCSFQFPSYIFDLLQSF